MKKLTVLSYGAGQDSTAILVQLLYNKEYRKEYAPDDLIVVMADTGNEHPGTNQQRIIAESICKHAHIPFFFLNCTSEYYVGDWNGGYINFLESGNRIGSKSFPKTCTDRLKIRPIYKFLDIYVHMRYNTKKHGRKAALKEFAKFDNRINMLIGIAKGEESRVAKEGSGPSWMNKSINRVYPLIEKQQDRQACHDVIKYYKFAVPEPSNCVLCPWMNLKELLYLYRVMPKWYFKWVELEANKIKKNAHMGAKNMGVWGKKLLPEVLDEAQKKHGHISNQELEEYKFSHGHCVKSKY